MWNGFDPAGWTPAQLADVRELEGRFHSENLVVPPAVAIVQAPLAVWGVEAVVAGMAALNIVAILFIAWSMVRMTDLPDWVGGSQESEEIR